MKLTKLTLTSVAAALALGAFGVKAAPAPTITTNYLKLSVALTVNQQALDDTNRNGDGKTYIWTTKTTKIGNKELLSLLAEAFEKTNWPAGAQLEYDHNSSQVIVADKTGTNILFYCGTGINDGTNQAYLYFYPYSHSGPYTEKDVNGSTNSISSSVWTEYYKGEIELYYYNGTDDITYASFYYGSGQNIDKWSAKWNASDIGTWSEKMVLRPTSNGTVDDGVRAQLTGKITANGKGLNPKF